MMTEKQIREQRNRLTLKLTDIFHDLQKLDIETGELVDESRKAGATHHALQLAILKGAVHATVTTLQQSTVAFQNNMLAAATRAEGIAPDDFLKTPEEHQSV